MSKDLEALRTAYADAEAKVAVAHEAVTALSLAVYRIGTEIARMDPETDEYDRAKIERNFPLAVSDD